MCPGWWDFRVSFYFLVRDVFICLIPDLSAFVFHSRTFQCWVVIAVQGSGDEAMPRPAGLWSTASSTLQTLRVNVSRGDAHPMAMLCPLHCLSPLPLVGLCASPWPRALAACTGRATSCSPTRPALVHIHLEQGGC